MDSITQGGEGLPPGVEPRVDVSPTNPLQSSLCKDISSMVMSDTQNMMTVPVGNNNRVTYIINASRENKPMSNAQHHDLRDLATTARADHEIYSSQLLTKKRGFPLWVPGPGRQLPIEYRRQGISIGDVGIITSLGAFTFLFNIFYATDHPINRGGVPRAFSPLSLEALVFDIQQDMVYGPKTYLASSSVRMISMDRISESSIVQKFESTEKEAAILIMPDGATTQDLLNTQAICDTLSRNAENWYQYARVTRGRRVKNGDIRVVVGIDKVSSWGIATSACNTGQTAAYEFKHDPTHTYTWECIGGSGRVGPQKSDIRDLIEDNTGPQNQCVFVRTINFTLSGELRSNFPSEAVQELEPGSDGFDYQDSTSSNGERPREGHGSSESGRTSSGYQPSSTQRSLNRSLSVTFDPVELGVDHPSAALHNLLHEKFPDASVIITEDVNWISVLNDDDAAFPEPEDLCRRVLETHDLQNNSGVIRLLTKDKSRPRNTSPSPNDSLAPLHPEPALTSLLTPSLLNHFSTLPLHLQSDFLLTLLRHTHLPVLQTLHAVITPALARDFLTHLPPELVSQILLYLPVQSLASAACVSKAWRQAVISDAVVWKDVLISHGLWFGGGSESAFVNAIYSRRKHTQMQPTTIALPHPYCTLFKSRVLTCTKWENNPSPKRLSIPAHGSAVVTCLIFSHNRIISASDDHSIHVYSPFTGDLLHSLQGHEGGIWSLAACRDTVLSGSTDRTIRIWDVKTGKCTHVFGGHHSTIRCLAIVKPEMVDVEKEGGVVMKEKWPKRSLIVTGSRDHSLRVWTLPRPTDPEYTCLGSDELQVDASDVTENPYHRALLEGHDHAIRAIAARGRTLVSGSYDCTVRIWDLITGKCKFVLVGHTQKVYSIVLDMPRKQACSGSMDATVRVWSVLTGECIFVLMAHTSLVGLLGLSPSYLVSGGADATIRVWNLDSGELVHTLAAHTGAITCCVHDEFKVLSASDGDLKMWDMRDGEVVRELLEGVQGVWQVACEGRWCVAASNRDDGTVLDVWDFGRFEGEQVREGEEAEGEREDGWVGEVVGGVYDDDAFSDVEDEEEEEEVGRMRMLHREVKPKKPLQELMNIDGDFPSLPPNIQKLLKYLWAAGPPVLSPAKDASGSDATNVSEDFTTASQPEQPWEQVQSWPGLSNKILVDFLDLPPNMQKWVKYLWATGPPGSLPVKDTSDPGRFQRFQN